MKKFLLVILFLVVVCSSYKLFKTACKKTGTVGKVINSAEENDKRIQKHIKQIKEFLQNKTKYNKDIVFLIDMKIMSGRNRFFIYDLKTDKIIDKGLVAHGCGSETGIENKLKFSNVDKSLATSLGKYYVGESYTGQFGKSYKLYGLDSSNSNAYMRNIVLHKFSKMPYDEQVTPVCNSYGCPMVNEIYFKRIEKILDTSDKKILLEIYY